MGNFVKTPSGPGTVTGDTHVASLTGSRSETMSAPAGTSGAVGTTNSTFLTTNFTTTEANVEQETITTNVNTKAVAVTAVIEMARTSGSHDGTWRLRKGAGTGGTILTSVTYAGPGRFILTAVDSTPGTSNQAYTVTFQANSGATGDHQHKVNIIATRVDDTHAASLTGVEGSCQ